MPDLIALDEAGVSVSERYAPMQRLLTKSDELFLLPQGFPASAKQIAPRASELLLRLCNTPDAGYSCGLDIFPRSRGVPGQIGFWMLPELHAVHQIWRGDFDSRHQG